MSDHDDMAAAIPEHPDAAREAWRGPPSLEAAERRKALLLRVVRIVFAILFAVVTGLALIGGGLAGEGAPAFWPLTLAFAATVGVAVIAVDLLTPVKKISTIVSVMFGLLAAMLATTAVGFVIELLVTTYDFPISSDVMDQVMTIVKILIGVGLAYLAISTVLQTQDDFRLVIPYVEFAKQIRGARPMVLDTSALIDARIADVGETGLIQAPLIVPRFVVEELQRLSDSGDKMKRARGRRGLDLIGRLQRSGRLDVTIDESPVPGMGVDSMLVELARSMSAIIVTTDTGLARVAQIQDVPVLNMNDLANAMKLSVIPGQELTLELTKEGEQAGQGVGYLDDGTMVVAEDGAAHVGAEVRLTVTTSMQTSAGRLIFGRVGSGGHEVEADETGPEAGAPERDEAPVEPRRARRPESTPRQTSQRNPRR